MLDVELEATDAQKVARLVHKYGVAIWRGLVPSAVTDAMIKTINDNLTKFSSYASIKGGVLHSLIFSEDLRKARVTPEIRRGIHAIIGCDGIIPDDGSMRSGIYLSEPTANAFQLTHPWHQDVGNEFPEYSGCVWIALSPGCGLTAPGVSFVLDNPGKAISAEDMDELVKRGPVFNPVLNVGDGIFFDSYTVHATYRRPEMTHMRASFKLMGISNVVPDGPNSREMMNWPGAMIFAT